ncbi:hypothetical protein [Azospirillum sp. sgz302134]
MTGSTATIPGQTSLPTRFLIASPQSWRPLFDAAAASLGCEERRLFLAIVQRLHGDHVGIGMQAAAGLARLLGPAPPLDRLFRCHPWSLLPERLARTGVWRPDPAVLSGEDFLVHKLRRQAHALVARLIGPLVQRACDEHGLCILFGGNGHADPVDFPSRYAAYEAETARILERLIEGEECALSMTGWSLSAAGFDRTLPDGAPAARLPQGDSVTTALALTLQPELPPLRPLRRSVVNRTNRTGSIRQGVRPQQGGISGIRHSRRHEDLNQILDSEFLLPRVLRMERMANAGFLMRDRPPYRLPRRDLLILFLVDASGAGDAVRLAQASWLLFLMGALSRLRDVSPKQVDAFWANSDSQGLTALHGCAADLELWPSMPDGSLPVGDARAALLDRLNCLPALTDRRRPVDIRLAVPNDRPESAVAWMKGAMQALASESGRHSADYEQALFLLAMPSPASGQETRRTLTQRLAQAVEREPGGGPPSAMLGVLWMPAVDGGQAGQPWILTTQGIGHAAPGRREVVLRTGSPADAVPATREGADRAAGAILDAWFDILAKVL